MPLAYRITQVSLHNDNKIIIAVTIMHIENPGINGGGRLFHIIMLSGKKECLYRYDIA
jgi:hypothetical protein